jgi:hypothetical protein
MRNLGCISGKVHISAQVDNEPTQVTIILRFPEGCYAVWLTETEANDLTDVINHVVQTGDDDLSSIADTLETFKSADKGDCTCG